VKCLRLPFLAALLPALVLLVSHANGSGPERAAAGPARTAAGKPLRIGVGRSNPPLSYVEEGKITGYWVELVAETAKVLGYAPEITADVWDTVKGEVASGRLDVAASMADLPERHSSFEFSVPVSTMAYAIWVRRGSPIGSMEDLGGRSVVLQRGSVMADRMAAISSSAILSFVPDDVDALVLLDSGRYEAAILTMSQGLYFARKLKLANVHPLPGIILSVEQCFAVAKSNERLARELDAGLYILKQNGRLDEIYTKWLGVYERPLPGRAPAWLVAGLAIAGLLLVLFLGFLLALHRTVRLRTAELAANERKYRVLAESLPQMIFVKDRDSTYLSCNRRYAEALGIEPGDIVGKTDYDFYPRDLADKYGADDRAAMDSPGSIDIVERWERPGIETWINMVKTPIRDHEGEVTGVIGIFWDVSERLRMEEATKRSLSEKEVLLHEVNHRVKNNLQLINAIIRLELDESPGPEIERFVRDTTARISSIATVHEMFYASEDLTDIQVGDYLRHIVSGLLDTYSRPDRKVEISVDAEGMRLDLSRMVSLGLMANEMITNSLKYAFEGKDSGRIAIRMARDDGAFLFRYEDDGVGLPADFDEHGRKSLGMVFIESLAKQLDGEVAMRSEGGLEYELRFRGSSPDRAA
jgi:PAS domain S-box-containing protein